ncbi:MAG: segregation/condensation protein A [Schwartzia sp.]|nr:segregation/condensation protein A [Schwartzia sp. (in: firmicutes)]
MELLVHLIQVNKLDIYDIPIAALTEQYMAYLSEMRRFDIEVASEFLVMAATLLLIKSRMMLPKAPKETEEEDEDDDPRRELVRRIVEYQRYKKVSLLMEERAEDESRYVGRAPTELPVRFAPPQGLSVQALWDAFRTVLAVKRELTIPEAIVAHEEYRVEDQMQMICERLLEAEDGVMTFEDLFSVGTRDELVATFLALLELIRRRVAVVRQPKLFGPIRVELRGTDGIPAAMMAANEG